MASLIANPQARASFQQQLFPSGIDHNRSELHRRLGVYRANPGTTFRAGQAVMLNSVGEVVLSDGTAVLGLAGWSKVTLGQTLVVDQSVTFGVANATALLKPNIISGSLQVRSLPQGGGTLYTVTTDYTVNLSNGTITQVGAGSIDPTLPVYVTYSRSLTEFDYQLEGKNFWQTLDYVTIQDLRVEVLEAPFQVYTTEFDTSQAYALTGALSNLYVNSSGILTSDSSGNKLVGHCISVPSATDPFLGVDWFGFNGAQT